jgi:dihydrofolate reductase
VGSTPRRTDWLTVNVTWLQFQRPLVREGAPQKQDSNFQTATFRQELIFGRKSQSRLDAKIYWLTNWPSVLSWLQLQRPLVREGASQKQDHNFQTATFRQEVIFGRKSQIRLDAKIYWLTDWPSVLSWLQLQRPLVREGAPQKQDHNFQTATFRQEVISGRKSQSRLDAKIYWLTDWLTDR